MMEAEQAATAGDPVEKDLPGEIVQNNKTLMVYMDPVPGTELFDSPLHNASIIDTVMHDAGMPPLVPCVVMRRSRQHAYNIANLLGNCDHPNVLKPSGVWDVVKPSGLYDTVSCHERTDIDTAYVTFQVVDGTLQKVPAHELFLLETRANNTVYFQGFAPHGLKVFSDIVSAVNHVNKMYHKGSAGTSSGGSGTPPPLLPLQLRADRMLYQKIPTGEYHVLLGDFHNSQDFRQLNLRTNPTFEDIQQANWKGLGNYLNTLIGTAVPSPEILQLVKTMKGGFVTLNDLMWEPALWDAKTRMRFTREVHMCVGSDSTGTRKTVLSKRPALGLRHCIDRLGITYTELNLLDSVTFLRNKIIAHYDDLYNNYPGAKEEIGMEKVTIEKFLVKEKPDYMIKLVKEIRQLNWIDESPLSRSKNDYMPLFKRTCSLRN